MKTMKQTQADAAVIALVVAACVAALWLAGGRTVTVRGHADGHAVDLRVPVTNVAARLAGVCVVTDAGAHVVVVEECEVGT